MIGDSTQHNHVEVEEFAVSAFQLLFFEQLEALPARRRSVLMEQARKAGIPREAAEAFWHTVRKPEAA